MSLMHQLAKAENACCIYAYHVLHSDISAKKLAKHLGLSVRRVRAWRQLIREQRCKCENAEHCAYRKGIIIAPEYPRVVEVRQYNPE